MGVSSDTFLVSIVTKYYPDMKRLFVFVKSLCSICCSEMCGSIMSYCTTGQTGVRTVQHHRSVVAVLRETVGTVVPTQWQSLDNVSRFWLSQGPDIDRTMFLDFLLSQGLDIRRTIFQGLDRRRTFLSMQFSTNSEDFNFDEFLFWCTHHSDRSLHSSDLLVNYYIHELVKDF